MLKSYSIAQARDQFTELVREVERESTIRLTRRGKLVAWLLSPHEYERLQANRIGFWDAYLPFRQQLEAQKLEIDVDQIFADVREQTPGRPAEW